MVYFFPVRIFTPSTYGSALRFFQNKLHYIFISFSTVGDNGARGIAFAGCLDCVEVCIAEALKPPGPW